MIREDVREFAESVKIPALVHFTTLANLESILQNGLYCRDQLNNDAIVNDNLRLDQRTDTISTSIAFPNSSMFYKYRQEKGGSWVIIAISKRVLWELDCLFCRHNAADGRISCLPESNLAALEAFKSMYAEEPLKPTRADLKLRSYDPTDVQAEVLVKGHIPKKYIVGVAFPDTPSKEKFAHLTGKLKVVEHSRNKGLFAARTYVRR